MNTKFNETVVETNGVRTVAGGGTGTTTLGSLRNNLQVLPLSGGTLTGNTQINANLTVYGDISANNTIWDSNGNSNQWNSVYTSYNEASSDIATKSYATLNFIPISYIPSNFLPLSGGTMIGRLSAQANKELAKLNIGNAISSLSSNPWDIINGDIWINSGSRLAYKSNSSV